MTDRNERLPRAVAIPDHLWELFEDMARKMGTERDGLVCQAMFIFARLNGFLEAPGSRLTATGASLSLGGSAPAVTAPSPVVPGSAEPTGPMATSAALLASAPEETAALSGRTFD